MKKKIVTKSGIPWFYTKEELIIELDKIIARKKKGIQLTWAAEFTFAVKYLDSKGYIHSSESDEPGTAWLE